MDLLHLLSLYQPINERDRRQAERLRKFVEKNERCFERDFPPGHLTGSAWLVDSTGTKVLLTHHKKLNKWLQLGGHADGDRNLLSVALREAREESGLTRIGPVSREIFDVDIHLIPAFGSEPDHYHYDVRFVIRAEDEGPLHISGESHDLAWVEVTRISELTPEESLLRMASKWAKFQLRRGF